MGALITAPRTARIHLRDSLKEWGLPELIEDGELIASELVMNIAQRVHGPVTGVPVHVDDRLPVLQFGLFSDWARLPTSVWDQLVDPLVPKMATADDEPGRDLMMVGRGLGSAGPVPGRGREDRALPTGGSSMRHEDISEQGLTRRATKATCVAVCLARGSVELMLMRAAQDGHTDELRHQAYLVLIRATIR
jgi:hypothetical protein